MQCRSFWVDTGEMDLERESLQCDYELLLVTSVCYKARLCTMVLSVLMLSKDLITHVSLRQLCLCFCVVGLS